VQGRAGRTYKTEGTSSKFADDTKLRRAAARLTDRAATQRDVIKLEK